MPGKTIEQRKLEATFWNNLATQSATIGIIAPASAIVIGVSKEHVILFTVLTVFWLLAISWCRRKANELLETSE